MDAADLARCGAQPGEWELTTMSAVDVVRFYDGFLDSAPTTDRDYLIDLLRRTSMRVADEFDQFFGSPSALPGQVVAIKQGWLCCPRTSATCTAPASSGRTTGTSPRS
ncbi:hypothetical protein BH20ACT5_BH20ACT5_17600 [soil metagenome]